MSSKFPVLHNDCDITKKSMATLLIQRLKEHTRILCVCCRNKFFPLHFYKGKTKDIKLVKMQIYSFNCMTSPHIYCLFLL